MKKDFFPRWPSTQTDKTPEHILNARVVAAAELQLAKSLNMLARDPDPAQKSEIEQLVAQDASILATHILPPAIAERLSLEAPSAPRTSYQDPSYSDVILLAQTVDATQNPEIKRALEYVLIHELPVYGELIADAYATASISGQPIMKEYLNLSSKEDDLQDPLIREPGPRPSDYPN